ncbi:MAG: hypothetical protein RIR62_1016 [Pseudomonadota bacterium]
MTMKPVFAAVAAVGLMSGCVAPTTSTVQTPGLVAMGGVTVQPGIPCAHLVEEAAKGVAGCEGYLPVKPMSAGEAAQIADLNARFSASVSPVAYFEFGESDLTASARGVLDAQADWMLTHSQILFTVYGHTDLVGSEGYNFDLAKRRAENVVAYLATRGVPSAQLVALVSYGETRPAIVTEAREGQNRRTVTEVSAFLTEPRLITAEQVPCAIIETKFLASYPACVEEPSRAIAPPPPPPPPVEQETEITTGTGTNTTTTYARLTTNGTTEERETTGSAGNGSVTSGASVTTTTTERRISLDVNGEVQEYVTDPDGSNARRVP